MDGVDKEKVQKVVYDMSKGSKYFENEQRREAMVAQKIQQMQAQAAVLNEPEIEFHEKAADIKISALEAGRDLSRIWMHVDLDAFYAAVETLEDPSLVGKPLAVGGMSMICTANYEARKFGVRAAMPGFIACRLCPELTFIRPNFEKYTHYSEKVRQVFRDYDPQFLARSLDEAYLDITKQCSLRNMSSEEIADELRKRVHDVTGLTCSAGVGPNRMIAKVCSDINKPNGQFVVPNERDAVMTFISTLPIRKISGIGKVTERLLKDILSITLCEDLIKKRGLISALFSSISADFFLSVGLGIGGSETPLEEPRKSLSCERTFAALSNEESLFAKLEELAENVAQDMDSEGLQGRTITLKLKTVKFEVRTRSVTLPSFVHKKEDLLFHSSKLLKVELPVSLRLMGLRISHFQGESSDMNQRTLSDFFSTDDREACRMATSRDVDPCEKEQGCLKRTALLPCSPPEPSVSKTMEVLTAASPGRPISPFTCSPGLSVKSMTGTDDTCSARNEIAHLSCMTRDSSTTISVKMAEQMCGDISYQPVDIGTDFDCKFLSDVKWIDDSYCSLCKLEIPSFLAQERQEHFDFHFAQILQYRYSNGGDLEEHSRDSDGEGKRHSSHSLKETPPKRVRAGRAESKRHRPIETFFSRI